MTTIKSILEELPCGHTGVDWNGEGACITCSRDELEEILNDESNLKKVIR